MRARAAATQVALVAAVAFTVWYLASNTAQNLDTRKIASGFGFLQREAGFEIGETPFLAYGAADNYARALLVGLINTFRVALIGVVLATLLGTLLGLARLSRNWLLSRFAAGYVEVVRNVPLLVQLFFLYAVITENLPGPREALEPLPGVFLSNRGITHILIKQDNSENPARQLALTAFLESPRFATELFRLEEQAITNDPLIPRITSTGHTSARLIALHPPQEQYTHHKLNCGLKGRL